MLRTHLLHTTAAAVIQVSRAERAGYFCYGAGHGQLSVLALELLDAPEACALRFGQVSRRSAYRHDRLVELRAMRGVARAVDVKLRARAPACSTARREEGGLHGMQNQHVRNIV